MRLPGWTIPIAYGGLAALILACLWLVALAPVRLGWGRELVGAAIAIVAMGVGLQLARRPASPRSAAEASPPESPATPLATEPATDLLSQREHEVLRCLADGLSNKEIARALSVSENTVKTHLANVYAKLGAGRRTEALKIARQRGLA